MSQAQAKAFGSANLIGQNAIEDKMKYDVGMWNPILFAIYYQKIDIVRMFLTDYCHNFILGIRMPPKDEFKEYI